MSFSRVTQLLSSITIAVELANAADKAYCNASGGKFVHVPFGADEPQKVAMNLAGYYAVDQAANTICAVRDPRFAGEFHAWNMALASIAGDDLTATERYIARGIANATWRAGQPFRALERIERKSESGAPAMTQFNELSVEEQEKDDVQLRSAARELFKRLATVL